MVIKAVEANEENFKPFGRFVKLNQGDPRTGTGGWMAWTSKEVCMDDIVNIGMCHVKGMPFEVDSMECHHFTEEVLICGDTSLVLAVANTDPQAKGAKPEDIRAFIINPGSFVTLYKGIWHDACRCKDRDSCYYYFLAHSGLEPAIFYPIDGEPVKVEL